MANIHVSDSDYTVGLSVHIATFKLRTIQVLASILKDGPGQRYLFTFKEVLDVSDSILGYVRYTQARQTLENIGFVWDAKGRMVYDGKTVLIFKVRTEWVRFDFPVFKPTSKARRQGSRCSLFCETRRVSRCL